MVDQGAFRKAALALPEAEEVDHRGHPAYAVRGKIFATLWPKENRAILKLNVLDQTDLISSSPKVFSLNAWSKQGWTNMNLEFTVISECGLLLESAWRNVAPKRLQRVYDESRSA
jgi:hypothetical protein